METAPATPSSAIGGGPGAPSQIRSKRAPKNQRGSDPYARDFAQIYHEAWSSFIRAEAPAIVARLRGFRRVVDLACGTGVLAAALTRAGHDVLGLDASPAMLAIARRTAPRATFRRAAFGDPLPAGVDAVICTFDSLNYLRRPMLLTATFRRVAEALQPGGLFLFDMNTMHGLRVRWKGIRVHRGDGWFVLLELSSDARRRQGVFAITGFRRRGASWRRFREVHMQRGYTWAEIRACARAAGLRATRAGGYDGRPAPSNPRRVFVTCVRSRSSSSSASTGRAARTSRARRP